MGVILGITGSIAAYKAIELMRMLQKSGHDVIPVMTESATKFVAPLTFETLSKNPCHVYTFPDERKFDPEHISIVKQASIMVTAPATANIIAKYRWGIADDLLSLTALTFGVPHIIAPAMNLRMYSNPIYRDNERYLREKGYEFVDPARGQLAAEGEIGWGKLAPVEEIHARIIGRLESMGRLKGKRVLVSAGGNREMIDPVRCITNLSSGRMGYAAAREAAHRGAEVVLVTSSDMTPDFICRVIRAVSSAEMKSAIEKEFPTCDILIMAAAVSDFRPKTSAASKLERSAGGLTLEFEPTDDILASLRPLKGDRITVGFAAETGTKPKRVREKLLAKGVDMLVVNDVSRDDIGFNTKENEVDIYFPEKNPVHLEKARKDDIARGIWDEIEKLLS
jgi:phosphopantothenoylcysteine decarboxylase/phosphopantothenate--cysteine ligase